MADWIHCNKCFVKPTRELKRKFMLTSCSHMFCDQCLLEKKCHICKATCNVIVLSQQMKPDVEIFFKDPSQQLKKLTQVINFLRFFEKVLDFQKSHRERLNKRLLQQTEITSPNSNKIMERLKELKKENMVLHQENSYMKKLLSGSVKTSNKMSTGNILPVSQNKLSSIFLRRLLEGLEQEEIIDRKESAEGRTPNLPYSKPISQAELLVRLFENLEGQILTFYIKLRVVFKLLVTSCLSNWHNSQLKDILMNALNLHLKTGKCFLIKTAFSDATHICYRHAFVSGNRQKTSFWLLKGC
ncbi:RING finger protein 212B [Nymphon striatum]|nr:RING finger protein 212B [Nymphon striatum]